MASGQTSRFSFLRVEDSEDPYDLLVATCGYESRCSAVARIHHSKFSRIVSFTYPHNRVHSYEDNIAYFGSVGSVVHSKDLADFAESLRSELTEELGKKSHPRFAIDISSFNRERLGVIVRELGEIARGRAFRVTFLYSMATFDSHRETFETSVLSNGPLEGFEGWTNDPARPVACVVGLGFENLIALAALETLEPARTVAFVSQSSDRRFQARVVTDNAALLRSAEVSVVPYLMEDPFGALHSLEGVIHALQADHRVAIVPLGPKLFATLALLVAWEYQRSVTVWRVSSDQRGEVEDRIATGSVVELHTLVSGAISS